MKSCRSLNDQGDISKKNQQRIWRHPQIGPKTLSLIEPASGCFGFLKVGSKASGLRSLGKSSNATLPLKARDFGTRRILKNISGTRCQQSSLQLPKKKELSHAHDTSQILMRYRFGQRMKMIGCQRISRLPSGSCPVVSTGFLFRQAGNRKVFYTTAPRYRSICPERKLVCPVSGIPSRWQTSPRQLQKGHPRARHKRLQNGSILRKESKPTLRITALAPHSPCCSCLAAQSSLQQPCQRNSRRKPRLPTVCL
mmetsp:Transcript_55113/g.139188  ORF Transcript_55113/g.139188 Transcript_55113/m.139188 type:complete len:253 (+) Transcript_55113:181-939(+)